MRAHVADVDAVIATHPFHKLTLPEIQLEFITERSPHVHHWECRSRHPILLTLALFRHDASSTSFRNII